MSSRKFKLYQYSDDPLIFLDREFVVDASVNMNTLEYQFTARVLHTNLTLTSLWYDDVLNDEPFTESYNYFRNYALQCCFPEKE